MVEIREISATGSPRLIAIAFFATSAPRELIGQITPVISTVNKTVTAPMKGEKVGEDAAGVDAGAASGAEAGAASGVEAGEAAGEEAGEAPGEPAAAL